MLFYKKLFACGCFLVDMELASRHGILCLLFTSYSDYMLGITFYVGDDITELCSSEEGCDMKKLYQDALKEGKGKMGV